jgi:hypothetical protein
VVHNGTELFGKNLSPADTASYRTIIAVQEGDTIEFVIGRGVDGSLYGSSLRIAGSLERTTNGPSVHPLLVSARVVPLLRLFENQDEQWVLTLNNSAVVTLVASLLSDSYDEDKFDYVWTENAQLLPSSFGATVTNSFDLGIHRVTVVASDGGRNGTDTLEFEVITASEAVAELCGVLDGMALSRQQKRPLQASLGTAAQAFERGQLRAGTNLLRAFQNKLRAQLRASHPELEDELTRAAGRLIDAVESAW